VIANADDPLVVWVASAASDVTWVALGDTWTEDASSCPACGKVIAFGAVGWRCPACGLQRPEPAFALCGASLAVPDRAPLPLDLRLPGRCNRANVTMAAAAACALGVPPHATVEAASAIESVAGRYAQV